MGLLIFVQKVCLQVTLKTSKISRVLIKNQQHGHDVYWPIDRRNQGRVVYGGHDKVIKTVGFYRQVHRLCRGSTTMVTTTLCDLIHLSLVLLPGYYVYTIKGVVLVRYRTVLPFGTHRLSSVSDVLLPRFTIQISPFVVRSVLLYSLESSPLVLLWSGDPETGRILTPVVSFLTPRPGVPMGPNRSHGL